VFAAGVGQPAMVAVSSSVQPMFAAFAPSERFAVAFLLDALSCAVGVGQPASHATRPRSAFNGTSDPAAPSFQSRAEAVGQPAKAASAGSAPPAWFGPPFAPSVARGVFHPIRSPPDAASDVRGADAASRQIKRPAGVAVRFQVCEYKVEPAVPNSSRNLLAHAHDRA
jgi:hypothetical protein